jgi:hypothetical protein
MSRTRKAADGILVGLFLAALGGYASASLVTFLGGGLTEVASPLRTLPIRLERHFNAHLAARDHLIRWHAQVRTVGLNASTSPKVWLGRNGWLFYDHTAEPGFLKPHDPALPRRLDHWAAVLTARRAWLEEHGIRFLVVVVPDKQSVYPEVLPRVARPRGPTPLDHLLARCRRDPGLTLLDLREPLRAAKRAGPVYPRTDTHWNQDGAYAGYAATARALARWYPSLEPLPRTEFTTTRHRLDDGDLARLLGLTGRLAEDNPRLECRGLPRARRSAGDTEYRTAGALAHVRPLVWVQDEPILPRVLLLSDSFADDTYSALLAEHCARLVRIGTYQFEEAVIERERPDVVVCQLAERILQAPPPSLPLGRAVARR